MHAERAAALYGVGAKRQISVHGTDGTDLYV